MDHVEEKEFTLRLQCSYAVFELIEFRGGYVIFVHDEKLIRPALVALGLLQKGFKAFELCRLRFEEGNVPIHRGLQELAIDLRPRSPHRRAL